MTNGEESMMLAKCPICGSDNVAPSFTHRVDERTHVSVDRCLTCTHEFVNPQPSWEELSKFYSEDYQPWDPERISPERVQRQVAESRASGVARHVQIVPGMDLLDLGCGAGQFLDVVTQLGAKALGIDTGRPNTDLLAAAGLDVYFGTLQDYVDRDLGRRFDLITSSHVFEHLYDPVATLRLARSVLKPDGRIWIAVPNAGNWGYRWVKGHWHSTALPVHLHHFTPKSVESMVERAALSIHTIRTESLTHATAATIRQFLRYRAFVPQAISSQLPLLNSRFATWLGARLDRRDRGDAILVEIVRSPAQAPQ